jgi:hypothetical protein
MIIPVLQMEKWGLREIKSFSRNVQNTPQKVCVGCCKDVGWAAASIWDAVYVLAAFHSHAYLYCSPPPPVLPGEAEIPA